MNQLRNYSLVFGFAIVPLFIPAKKTTTPCKGNNSKIQVAILLDVSNSMDGLIEQAKSQLWNMVNVLGKIRCNDTRPQIEIALYEYGRPENDRKAGYVKKIDAFITDLDKLYLDLLALSTNGGEEYCGHAILNSVRELDWDTSVANYKVIFIAGNESFLQGNISLAQACEEAKKKGITVNTIYCGDKKMGIEEHWNLGAECGNGSFINIDQDAKDFLIPSPYDDTIITLKEKMNSTYIVYGKDGNAYYDAMMKTDTAAMVDALDPNKIIRYITSKANPYLYNNPKWDLVDALEKDSSIIQKVELSTLADSLKNKSREELKKVVKTKSRERRSIQEQINTLEQKQRKFVHDEKIRRNLIGPKTLESEIEKMIRNQVKRLNMTILTN
jgi:hypothetical protein